MKHLRREQNRASSPGHGQFSLKVHNREVFGCRQSAGKVKDALCNYLGLGGWEPKAQSLFP